MAVDPIRGAGDPQTRVVGTQTAALFEEHGRMVYGLCRTLLRDPDDADDATQSTFISAYTALLGGTNVREAAAWLATIARNECTARAHARMREPLPLLDADLGHTQGPEAELERKAVVEELQRAISGLPEKQREAVVLRDLYGLHYAEVSAALGMSVASVESLLFRARRTLRVNLKSLASGALIVPVAVREGIAQALPGFTTAGAAGGGAASGAVGLGLLAKFTGVPVAVKIAAGVIAVTATGSVAVVGAEHAGKQPGRAPAYALPQASGARGHSASGTSARSGLFIPVFVSERAALKGDESGTGRAGSGDDPGDATSEKTSDRGHDGSDDSGSPSGGRKENGGASGSRSVGDDGAGTATHSGHGDSTSDSSGSHDGGGLGGGSGDARVPESGDGLLGTDTSGSDPDTSGDPDTTDDSGTSGGSGDSDRSDSSGDSEAAGSDSADSDDAAPPPPT